jgi:hypothetical protein
MLDSDLSAWYSPFKRCDERSNFSCLESVKFDEVTEERLAKSVQKTDGAMTPRQVRPVMGLGRHCTIETPQQLWLETLPARAEPG